MARKHVAALLAGWGLGDFAGTAEVITSELVTNAVQASAPAQGPGGTPVIRVCVVRYSDALAIECWDQAPGTPALRQPTEQDEGGRGLAIIEDLTGGAWGTWPAVTQPGKCVWAEIPLNDSAKSPPVALPGAAVQHAGTSGSRGRNNPFQHG